MPSEIIVEFPSPLTDREKKMIYGYKGEVVRCQICASWGTNSFIENEKGEKVYGDCLHFCLATPKWFYCAWGERKEDDD